MTDDPRLPQSPLSAMREDEPDVFGGPWRGPMRRLGYVLVGTFGVGAVATLAPFGNPPHAIPDLDDLSRAVSFPGACLLLGALALQLARGVRDLAPVATGLSVACAVLVGSGFAYVMVENWGDETPVIFGACGVAASALLMVVSIGRRLRALRHVAVALAIAAIVPPIVLATVAWLPHLSLDLRTITLLACTSVLPVTSSLAIIWLIRAEPEGSSVDD